MCLPKEKDLAEKTAKSLFYMAPQAGFEPATNGLTVRCATAAPLRNSNEAGILLLHEQRVKLFRQKSGDDFLNSVERVAQIFHASCNRDTRKTWRAKCTPRHQGNAGFFN